MESSQRSPGLRPRTPGEPSGREAWWEIDRRGCRLVVVLLSPPAAALRWSVIVFIIPCLAARLAWQQSRGASFSGTRWVPCVGGDVLIGPFRWCVGYRGPLGTAAPTEGPFLSIVKALGPSAPLIRHGFAVPPSPQRVEGFALAFPLPGGRCPRRGRMRVTFV